MSLLRARTYGPAIVLVKLTGALKDMGFRKIDVDYYVQPPHIVHLGVQVLLGNIHNPPTSMYSHYISLGDLTKLSYSHQLEHTGGVAADMLKLFADLAIQHANGS